MEPIITVESPTPLIKKVSVFPATYNDIGLLQFPVMVDECRLTFYLDDHACWVYQETIMLPDEIKNLVGDLIERHHA